MSRMWVLDDAMWARVEPLLPSSAGRRGVNFRDHRQVIEGILYRLRTSVPWRDLPACYGPWQTVWKRQNRFSKDGTWDRVLAALQVQADAAGLIDWNVAVDSTIARAHQHGTKPTSCDGNVTGALRRHGLNRVATPLGGCAADWVDVDYGAVAPQQIRSTRYQLAQVRRCCADSPDWLIAG